nr:RHS repeat-associated core domain-containing protein [Capillibacterium thermochitinicola]
MTNGKYAFVYDENGNLIQKGEYFTIEGDTVVFDPEEKDLWTYEYDLLNRLTKVEKDGKVVAEYLYDEAGLRVQKKSPDTTVYYVFDQSGQVLYEEEDGEYLAYVYVLGKHFARVDGKVGSGEKQTYFYHTDHLGSTVLVTDEAGQAVWSTEYTPFGSLTIAEGKLKRAAKFTGKDLDEDTGLYYFNARWYDSELGRFISEDPVKDGVNWYTYANNNPLLYVDPLGLAAFVTKQIKSRLVCKFLSYQ